jgi:hypothetical protein
MSDSTNNVVIIQVEDLHRAAETRAPGYLEEALSLGKVVGGVIYYQIDDYVFLRNKYQPDLPPLTSQAASLLSAAKSEAEAIARGEKSVSYEEKQRRLDICKSCPELTVDDRCSLCGCYMKTKTGLRTAKCAAAEPKW